MKKAIKKEEKEVVEKKAHSAEYKAMEALIEKYKKENPAKYEVKKEILLAKLNTL